MDAGEVILLSFLTGLAGGLIGQQQGRKEGYNQARAETQRWVHLVSAENAAVRNENVRISQENGSLRKENEVLKSLLRQQPTTPQAEAILNKLGKVEFRLTQLLPPAFESSDHDTSMN